MFTKKINDKTKQKKHKLRENKVYNSCKSTDDKRLKPECINNHNPIKKTKSVNFE